MLSDPNRITLVGALADAPSLTATAQGQSCVLLTVAGSRRAKTSDGRPRSIIWRHRVGLVGSSGSDLMRLQPGIKLRMDGELRSRAVLDEDGLWRHVVRVHCHRLRPVEHPGTVTFHGGRYYLADALNEVTVVGTLARELRMTTTRAGVARARSALINHTGHATLPDRSSHNHIPFVLWGDLAERYGDAAKGTRVRVKGMYLVGRFLNRLGRQVFHPTVEATDMQYLPE
jgi:single-stranded DNA-binding protein